MLYDWCTWDVEYNMMVQQVRAKLVSLATEGRREIYNSINARKRYFSVEAVIGSVIPKRKDACLYKWCVW